MLGYEDIERGRKPRGGTAANHAETQDFGSAPAALILAYARDVDLRDVRVRWEPGAAPPERHAIWATKVERLRIDGFTGRQAAPDGRLSAILLNDTAQVLVNGSRAEAGTGTFLEITGAAAGQPVLSGNDLRQARKELDRK